MKETFAKTQICPLLYSGMLAGTGDKITEYATCLGSRCMWWKPAILVNETRDRTITLEDHGSCGAVQ